MNYKIILASNSPRRKELLAGLDIPFEVKVISGIDESYPADLDAYQVAEFICKKKAEAYRPLLNGNNSVEELGESETLILTASSVESQSAPKRLLLPLIRARRPSIISKRPAARIMNPPHPTVTMQDA